METAPPTHDTARRIETWVQVAILVLTALGGALHVAGRLAAIEQWETSADADRAAMTATINRIEQRIDTLTERDH